MTVLVVCPTRDRPDIARVMCESFKNTASIGSELVLAVDSDQADMYESLEDLATIFVRPRSDMVQTVNNAVKAHLGDHSAVGMMVDDAVFATDGWDKYVRNHMPLRGVISPAHNYGRHVDMPYVHRGWIERLGWYANPEFKYWCWPVFTGILAETARKIVHAPEQSFFIQHDDLGPRYWEYFEAEAKVFYEQCQWNLWPLVEMLR